MTGRWLGMCNDISAQTTDFKLAFAGNWCAEVASVQVGAEAFIFIGFNQNSLVTVPQSDAQQSLQTQIDEMKQTLKAIQQQIEKLQEGK
nr:DUF5320 family protein [uncultured Desulfobacter sp.]